MANSPDRRPVLEGGLWNSGLHWIALPRPAGTARAYTPMVTQKKSMNWWINYKWVMKSPLNLQFDCWKSSRRAWTTHQTIHWLVVTRKWWFQWIISFDFIEFSILTTKVLGPTCLPTLSENPRSDKIEKWLVKRTNDGILTFGQG